MFVQPIVNLQKKYRWKVVLDGLLQGLTIEVRNPTGILKCMEDKIIVCTNLHEIFFFTLFQVHLQSQ